MRVPGTEQAGRHRLGVLVRALRWRADSSLALLLVALVAAIAAAAGPIYLQAAGASALRAALLGQPTWQTGLAVSKPASTPVPLSDFEDAARAAPTGAGGAPLFGSPIITELSGIGVQRFTTTVASRTGVCSHLVFVAGGCPVAPGVVAISQRDAASLHVSVGAKVPIGIDALHGRTPGVVEVGGVFRLPNVNAAYWWGDDYFPFGGGAIAAPLLDYFFAAQSSFGPHTQFAGADTVLQLPLDIDTAQATGPSGVVAAVNAYQSLLRTPAFGLTSLTSVVDDLDTVMSEQHLMNTVVAVVDLELVLLALCVLYSTVARTAEERRGETRLARLRGFPTSSVISVAVSEPALMVLVSFPLGIFLAWIAVVGVGAALFTSGTPIGLPLLAIGTGAAACVGAALAIALSGWQLARAEPLADRGSVVRRNRLRRDSLDLAAIVLAVAALVELSTTGVLAGGNQTDPVAALAPALVALGLAVVGMRVVPVAAAGVVRLTRRRGRLAPFLAARRITRRPPLVRQMVLLSVAFSLLVFASAGWVVANHNRGVYADFSIGAPQVASVTIPRGADFVTDVRRADPGGRQAMAVAEYDGSNGRLLAVDTPRLAEVATWPAGLSELPVGEVAQMLDPATLPAVTLDGGDLRTTVTYLPAQGAPVSHLPQVSLVATVFDETYQATETAVLATLQPGTHTYVASIAGDCGTDCRLVSLSPSWAPALVVGGIPVSAPLIGFDVQVDSIAEQHGATFAPLDAHLGDPSYWRPVAEIAGQPPAGPDVSTNGTALVLSLHPDDYYTAANGLQPAVAAGDTPSPIPVVMTDALAGVTSGPVDAPVLLEGLDGNTLTASDVLNVPLLPGVGDTATLVDLTFALNSISLEAADVHYQVWLTADASPAILQRLRADGFQITSSSSGSAIASTLGHGGLALAYDLFVFAAVAAVLLASGSTLFAIRVSARRTAADLAALLAVGVSRRTLRRSVVAEHAAVVAAGVALGVLGGALAVAVALGSLPELASTAGVPPLSHPLPAGAVAAVVGGAVVVLAAAVLFATALTMAGARPEVLREDVA